MSQTMPSGACGTPPTRWGRRSTPSGCPAPSTPALPSPHRGGCGSLWDTQRELVTGRYELLPRTIHLEASGSTRSEWLRSTLRLICYEAAELRAGGESVITRLADLLVVQAIRAWIQSDQVPSSWITALRDREVGRAIRLIHRHPDRGWTVASLAREVHMSRAAFGRRFKRLVGEPPMTYLTRWRMQLAVSWLRTGELRVAQLPHRLGYGSEAAFSRAFKRFVGVSPSAVRVEPQVFREPHRGVGPFSASAARIVNGRSGRPPLVVAW